MHRPPAVTWNVRRTRWHAGALICLVLVATLLLIGFLTMQGWGISTQVLLVLLLASALLATKGLYGAPGGQLNWDGAHWHWSDPDTHTLGSVACVLDLQTRMLVRIADASGASHWLWLECPTSDARWLALRRAIVASDVDVVVVPKNDLSGG